MIVALGVAAVTAWAACGTDPSSADEACVPSESDAKCSPGENGDCALCPPDGGVVFGFQTCNGDAGVYAACEP